MGIEILKQEMFTEQDKHGLQKAITLAQYARSIGEIPVGAVLVKQNEIIGEGYNCPIKENDSTAHAEIIAIRAASKRLTNYRLSDTTLYVTLEPCLMCVGAIVHARIKRVVFGAFDLKAGAVVSQIQVFKFPFLNHKASFQGGLLADECGELLSSFFKERRNAKGISC